MREEADAQFFQQPAEFHHPVVDCAFALCDQTPVILFAWAQLGQLGGIAGGVGAVVIKSCGDGLEVAGEVVELGEGRQGDEAFGHQPCQLGGDICGGLRGVFGVFEFAGGGGVFLQNDSD